MRTLLLGGLAALTLAATGCGSSSSSTSKSTSSSAASSAPAASSAASPAASSSGAVIQATMSNFAFHPAVIHAKVGQSIRWTNEDTAAHNVTGTGGPKFAASPTFPHGGSFTLKLTQPGTYTYICTIHPFMKGTIIVSS